MVTDRSFITSWRYATHLLLALVLSAVFVSVSNAALPIGSAAPRCVGDCDDSRTVTVDELVRGVNIALERQSVDTCKAFDSNDNNAVTVDELVQGVRSLLIGCDF